jgi:gliding motility-associated-like protein
MSKPMTVVVKNHRHTLAILLFIFCHAVAAGQLTANFTASPARSGCSPLVVNFTDSSTGNPTQWKWDLGNGVTSLLQHPSATYFNPGTYTIKLVVRNSAGADSVTRTDYITVLPNPTATFTADRTTGCFPLAVNFTDGSTPGTGTIVSWFWDFGDGTTSTQQNPSHIYTAAGNYTVTLRVINTAGCSRTFTRSQYITIANGVVAGFDNNDPGHCPAPATVNFINTSTGPGPLSYTWTFGDGGASNATDPSHNYNTNGTYSVMLIAISPQGCSDTIRKNNLISIGNINANFTAPDTVCVNDPLNLINTSTPTPISYLWDLGNGTSSTDQNPTASYSTPGLYTIKLVSNFGGCADSISKQIYVSPRPQAAFTGSPRAFCTLPATVNFINQSTGSGTVLWNFGDGITSTLNNPTHSYTTEGSFTVTLTVTNTAGCSETITQTDFIQVQRPQVTIAGLPRTGCAPITITPTATTVSNHTITNYLWYFGDGTTSSSATPTHTYNTSGTFTVTLVYTTSAGCTDSVVVPNAVRVGTKPTAAFTVTPTEACAFQNVQFTDISTGGVDQWLWTFGDGGTSTQQNPLYQYSDTGWFHVQLIVYNNTCPDTIRFMNAVHIKPPIAAFTVQNSCTDKFTKTFTDGSIGATSWFWNFGDGNTSTQPGTVHTYTATGTYTVTLTVTNDTCSHSNTQTVRVIDEKALFTAVDTVICRNQTATFISSGINSSNIASWSWNFGDGTTAVTDSIATHVYTSSGNYTVTLIITDLLGCTDTMNLPIRVYGPVADFSVPTTVSCLVNNSITFTDLSTPDGIHPIVKWEWNYGDGTIDSTGVPPYQHSYTGAGTYAVSLLVKDTYGCTDILTRPAAIIIAQPTADFFSADTVTCTGRPIQFTNTSTGVNPGYVWSFGDGAGSTADNPAHNYGGIGIYTIKLVVTDQYGCKDSLTRPDYIAISYPKAVFIVSDSVSTCPPMLVNFSHQSTDYTSLTWDFGDGTSSALDSPSHFYTVAGIYYATLTATGPGGCTDVAVKRIEIKGPSGSFTYTPLTGCKPLTVNFTGTAKNNATYTWDFADGTIVVTSDSSISHIYTNAGDFIPKLILTDAGGCSVPLTGTDTIKVTGVTAGFTTGTNTFCNDGIVQFNNTTVSNDFITGYQWNFGDGNTSTAQHPSHHYAAPGIYTVSLNVITQNGCQDSLTLTDTVKVYASPVISISNDSSGCTPVTVSFNGIISVGDIHKLKWQWNFGNGQTDTLQNPATQVYTVANGYTISTIATDDHGCADTATTIINAYPIPVTEAGPDVFICRGSFTQLNATGASTYNWNPASSLSCTACPNPLAAPTDSTKYFVTGTTGFGCTSVDSVIVRVHQPFTLQVEPGDTVCSGSTVHLRASGADQYTWFPSTAVADPNAGITTANPTITTLYTVVAKDNHNCFVDTGFVNIKVWPYPTVNAGADQTVAIGTTLTFQPTYSNDITTYQWNNPMQTLSCTTCPTPTVNTKGAQNTYSIQVKNEGGCEAVDEITIYTICTGGNLFIPNTFSPNTDGKNDKFYPRGSGLNQIKSLRIYDRWGEVVFAASNFNANDPSMGWDGSYKGKPLPPDVYVYTCEVVCQNNEVLIYNGNLTLLK